MKPQKRSKIFYSLALTACLMGAMAIGCSVSIARPQQDYVEQGEISREAVEQAINDIKSAYERREIMPMMDLLDRNFERYLDFKYEITKKFFFSKQLELMFVIDSILQNRDRVSVRLHWFKKTLDPGGVFYKREGSSQFVFRNSRRGLKLLYIRGDNPFF